METALFAFQASDLFGRGIVFALVGLSSLFYGFLIHKFFYLNECKKRDDAILNRMAQFTTEAHQILGELERDRQTTGPLVCLAKVAANTLQNLLHPTPQERYALFSDGTLPRPLSPQEIESIQVAMDNEASRQTAALEEDLHNIATIITLAPLLGLLGTVWGVMATFVGIVMNGGRPDIQAIAPGIAGALLTTVAGLLLAIPGVLFNNCLQKSVQDRETIMEDFTAAITSSLQTAKTAKTAKAATTPPPQDDGNAQA